MPNRDRPPPRSMKGKLSYDEVEVLTKYFLDAWDSGWRPAIYSQYTEAFVEKLRQDYEEVLAIRGRYA